MSYAIIRVEKVKSVQSVRRTLLHSFREQDTPNADPQLTPQNKNYFSKSFNEAMLRFHDCIPQKRVRKDAVLLCEYIVTASPEFFIEKSSVEISNFFTSSAKFLVSKHGAKNIVLASIHVDESTPHMHVYAVPITSNGRLSCKDFYGAPDALNKLQDNFYEHIIETSPSLMRGIKNTKIRHTDSKAFAQLIASDHQEENKNFLDLVRGDKIKTDLGDHADRQKATQAFIDKIRAQAAKISQLEFDKKALDMRLASVEKLENRIAELEMSDERTNLSSFVRSLPAYTVHADRFKPNEINNEHHWSRFVSHNDDDRGFPY